MGALKTPQSESWNQKDGKAKAASEKITGPSTFRGHLVIREERTSSDGF